MTGMEIKISMMIINNLRDSSLLDLSLIMFIIGRFCLWREGAHPESSRGQLRVYSAPNNIAVLYVTYNKWNSLYPWKIVAHTSSR